MLVLSRRVRERIAIGDPIQIVVVAIDGDSVRLGVVAPRLLRVDRQEVAERRQQASCDQKSSHATAGEVAHEKVHES